LKAYKEKGKTVDYLQLAEMAQKSENLEFLRGMKDVHYERAIAVYTEVFMW